MADAARFQFTVVALDGYTKTLRDLNKKAARTLRPFQQLGRSTAALGRELHLDKVAKGMQSMAQAGSALAESLGIASPALRAIGALGFGAGLAAAAAGAGYLGYRVAGIGTNAVRTASRLGMSATSLQRFRGAAELAGVGADTMQQALESLGQTMQDARWNRNPEAAKLFGMFTHGIATGPGGMNDVSEQMLRVLDAASKIKDPFARQKFLSAAGLSSDLMPLAAGGRGNMQNLMNQADEAGYVMKGQALRESVRFNEELWKFKVSVEGLAITLGVRLLPGLTSLVGFFDRLAKHPLLTMFGMTPSPGGGGLGTGALSPAGAAGAPGGGLPLGLRLNNPGNLRKWGSRPIVSGFASFDSPEAGLQAMATQLQIYQSRGWNTFDEIIKHYAPKADSNDVDAYVRDLSGKTGFAHDQKLDLHAPAQLAAVMSAMVSHEQSRQPFSSDQYSSAVQHAVTVEITGKLPEGVGVKATVNGAQVPTRIDRALATHLSVE